MLFCWTMNYFSYRFVFKSITLYCIYFSCLFELYASTLPFSSSFFITSSFYTNALQQRPNSCLILSCYVTMFYSCDDMCLYLILAYYSLWFILFIYALKAYYLPTCNYIRFLYSLNYLYLYAFTLCYYVSFIFTYDSLFYSFLLSNLSLYVYSSFLPILIYLSLS